MLQVPSSLAGLLSLLAPCFTQPSYRTFCMLMVGFVGRVRDCTVTGCWEPRGWLGSGITVVRMLSLLTGAGILISSVWRCWTSLCRCSSRQTRLSVWLSMTRCSGAPDDMFGARTTCTMVLNRRVRAAHQVGKLLGRRGACC